MIIYPAIDIKDGRCVRLYQGEMERETVYSDDPVAQGRSFADAGFQWLHIVDLNGAVRGMPENAPVVRKILKSTELPVQLGGGIRNIGQIKAWINEGVSRVILGTAAVNDPDLVIEACETWPGKIAISLDAHGEKVATEGWTERSELDVIDVVHKLEKAELAAVIYTDISRDGTGKGLNLDYTKELAKNVRSPVIASGGVGSIEDIQAVKDAAGDNVNGVIVGKALYDGRIDPKEALKIAA